MLRPGSPFNAVVPGASAQGEVGVAGETRWVFEAGSAGSTVLTFEYRQAWSDAPAVETARFPVTVDPVIGRAGGGS